MTPQKWALLLLSCVLLINSFSDASPTGVRKRRQGGAGYNYDRPNVPFPPPPPPPPPP
ncbi:hypothetical protein C0J52_16173, partial [Blattella germanica]